MRDAPDKTTGADSLDGTMTAPPKPTAAACCTVAIESPIDEEATGRTASAFKALGDPHRLTMVQLIAKSGQALCVCDLEEHVPLSQPTVSHHLKILAEAGILSREQRGRWAYYSIDPERLGELRTDLGDLCC